MSYKCWKKSCMTVTTELDAAVPICWAACAGSKTCIMTCKTKVLRLLENFILYYCLRPEIGHMT